MDIQLNDGICFEIFESVKITAPIIFTTAFDAYAIKAFSVNSIDYLLKPIDPELFRNSINKFKEHYPLGKNGQIQEMITEMPLKFKSRFLIKTGIHFKSVPVNEIESFFIQERSTFLITKDGKTMDIDYSLDQLEKMVNPEDFFRVNRNYLINIDFIKDMIGYSGNRIKVKMLYGTYAEPIIVSREKVFKFKEKMDR
jgi:DNA-binding LytR/AlgR family response regulator